MTGLAVEQVIKSFGSVRVLTEVTLSVPTGTRTAVVGASGSGKSTLLRLVAGFDDPDSGSIRLDGRTLAGAGQGVPAHRRGIGYVAQDGALFPHLSVERNIAFGLTRADRAGQRVEEMMDLVSLAPDLRGRYPHELSGGQQQRVALARALAPRPQVVLLDEPFSALDTGLRGHTRAAVVAALEATGVTTVLVTHDQDEALGFGDQVAVVDSGRVVQAGIPAEVFDAPASAALAAFLGPVVALPATTADAGVDTALGRLPVRHDRSGGRAAVLAVLRPSQVTVTDVGDRGAVGVVRSVRWTASHVGVGVRCVADPAVELEVPVPTHRAGGVEVGTTVGLAVAGGCLLYPAG